MIGIGVGNAHIILINDSGIAARSIGHRLAVNRLPDTMQANGCAYIADWLQIVVGNASIEINRCSVAQGVIEDIGDIDSPCLLELLESFWQNEVFSML